MQLWGISSFWAGKDQQSYARCEWGKCVGRTDAAQSRNEVKLGMGRRGHLAAVEMKVTRIDELGPCKNQKAPNKH